MKKSADRTGYTLVEMLIASVLVAALMSVVWSMMSMYTSYLTTGQTQAVEQQLTRSVFQWIEDDFQSAAVTDIPLESLPLSSSAEEQFFPMQAPSADSMDAEAFAAESGRVNVGDTPAQEETEILSFFNDDWAKEPPGQISLQGNSQSIRLTVARTPAYMPAGSSGDITSEIEAVSESTQSTLSTPENLNQTLIGEGGTPIVPEFQTIIWQFQPPGLTSGTRTLKAGLYRIQTQTMSLRTAMAQQESLRESAASESESSVTFSTLETLLSLSPAMATENAAPTISKEPESGLLSPQIDAIPEVVGFRLDYFSGVSWSSAWNSNERRGLPLAIRVRLRLMSPQDLEILNEFTGAGADEDARQNGETSAPLPNAATSSFRSREGSAEQSAMESISDPFESLPTRQIERIILLQPVFGPMPSPEGTVPQESAREPAEIDTQVRVGRLRKETAPNPDRREA